MRPSYGANPHGFRHCKLEGAVLALRRTVSIGAINFILSAQSTRSTSTGVYASTAQNLKPIVNTTPHRHFTAPGSQLFLCLKYPPDDRPPDYLESADEADADAGEDAHLLHSSVPLPGLSSAPRTHESPHRSTNCQAHGPSHHQEPELSLADGENGVRVRVRKFSARSAPIKRAYARKIALRFGVYCMLLYCTVLRFSFWNHDSHDDQESCQPVGKMGFDQFDRRRCSWTRKVSRASRRGYRQSFVPTTNWIWEFSAGCGMICLRTRKWAKRHQ